MQDNRQYLSVFVEPGAIWANTSCSVNWLFQLFKYLDLKTTMIKREEEKNIHYVILSGK